MVNDRDVQQSLVEMFVPIVQAFPGMTGNDFWFLVTAIRQDDSHPNRINADKALAKFGLSLPYYNAQQLAWIKDVTDARIETVFKQAKKMAAQGANEATRETASRSRDLAYDTVEEAIAVTKALHREGYTAEIKGARDYNPNTDKIEKYYVVKTDAPSKVITRIEGELFED